jgi:hypothetical protein
MTNSNRQFLFITSIYITPPTNPHWVHMVGYGPFFLWVIHKEDLCPSNVDINRLMIMMNNNHAGVSFSFRLDSQLLLSMKLKLRYETDSERVHTLGTAPV